MKTTESLRKPHKMFNAFDGYIWDKFVDLYDGLNNMRLTGVMNKHFSFKGLINIKSPISVQVSNSNFHDANLANNLQMFFNKCIAEISTITKWHGSYWQNSYRSEIFLYS